MKIATQVYTKLTEFIGDMTKIFDNCRFYNPKDTSFYKCADKLEAYFVQRIKDFRDNLMNSQNQPEVFVNRKKSFQKLMESFRKFSK